MLFCETPKHLFQTFSGGVFGGVGLGILGRGSDSLF